MAGWQLDDSKSFNDYTFPNHTIIPAGGFWLGYKDQSTSHVHDASGQVVLDVLGSFKSGLSKTGDHIYLTDGQTIVHVELQPSAQDGEENELSQSFTEGSGGCYTLPSPGAPNNNCTDS